MLRVLLTARWVGWTLLAVAALAVCALMTWWQVVRLESPGGSLLNAGYAFQWPLFGLFFAFLWWRMLSAEARSTAGDREEHARRPVEPVRVPEAASPFGPRPTGTAVGEAPAPGSARARQNARLAELARDTSREEEP